MRSATLIIAFACALLFPQAAQAGHTLRFEPERLDLGVVQEGVQARAVLRLRNAASHPVVVARITSSCGCTVARISDRVIAPGSFALVDVTIDTSLKRGRIVKTIEAETEQGERALAELVLFVRDAMHAQVAQSSLFSDACARCHAAPARGLRKGKALYQAVCAMCHGDPKKGAYAPPVAGLAAARIRQVLMQGLGKPMPAFAKEKGGPLSSSQIQAIASWLAHQ